MTEEYWANSQFSIVRHTGRMKIGGHVYIIVNKEGKDIFECSVEAGRQGREKAIEPGEPCDLHAYYVTFPEDYLRRNVSREVIGRMHRQTPEGQEYANERMEYFVG